MVGREELRWLVEGATLPARTGQDSNRIDPTQDVTPPILKTILPLPYAVHFAWPLRLLFWTSLLDPPIDPAAPTCSEHSHSFSHSFRQRCFSPSHLFLASRLARSGLHTEYKRCISPQAEIEPLRACSKHSARAVHAQLTTPVVQLIFQPAICLTPSLGHLHQHYRLGLETLSSWRILNLADACDNS